MKQENPFGDTLLLNSAFVSPAIDFVSEVLRSTGKHRPRLFMIAGTVSDQPLALVQIDEAQRALRAWRAVVKIPYRHQIPPARRHPSAGSHPHSDDDFSSL